FVCITKMHDARLFRYYRPYHHTFHRQVMHLSVGYASTNAPTQTVGVPCTGHVPTPASGKPLYLYNNHGRSRKFDAGTMCPSYRVTRDEQHLTRGRANTLRLALSGQMGEAGFASTEVRESLDLCVSCKGCKRECPTGVDMAKMKIEF